MKKILLVLFPLFFIVTACSPSPQVIQEAISKTQIASAPLATPTLAITPTPIPQTSIISAFEKNGFETCRTAIIIGPQDGVFEDGVTYKCFWKEPGTLLLIGYDGSLILVNEILNNSIQLGVGNDSIIESLYGNKVGSWINDRITSIQGGKQESDVTNFHVTLYIGKIYTGNIMSVILEIIPVGKDSHLLK